MPAQRPKPTPKAPLPTPPPAPPGSEEIRIARELHGKGFPAAVYANAISRLTNGAVDRKAVVYAQDLVARMAPRDPAEEMLVAQLLFAHARVMHLTEMANRQEGIDSVRVVNEYADQASNTYRRLMLGLAEYRRPPRGGDTFAVVKQTNIAGQQVIQNHENSRQTAPNEQGSNPDPRTVGAPPPAALPADAGRFDVPAFLRPAGEAVEAVHRPPDARGQGPVADERPHPR